MARRKEPAKVWIEGSLIKILPVNSNEVYFTDYDPVIYQKAIGVRWRVINNGYLQGWVDKKFVLFHYLIIERKKGFLCDYANRNKKDNTKENLRHVTRSESGINRNKQSSNKFGYVGVFWVKRRNRWQANIRVNGERVYWGYFKDAKKAHEAYLKAVEKFYPGILVKKPA